MTYIDACNGYRNWRAPQHVLINWTNKPHNVMQKFASKLQPISGSSYAPN